VLQTPGNSWRIDPSVRRPGAAR